MRARTVVVALLAAITLIAVPADAQGRGKGKEKKHEKERERGDDDDKHGKDKFERSLSREDDVRIVNQYFVNTAALPAGLAKRQTLPPGLARQLQVNGTLPPGLAKRVRPVPVTLTRQLVVLPSTQRRVIIGNQLVVLDAAQRVIDLFMLP